MISKTNIISNDPIGDMPIKDFREMGHKMIDWIADHFEGIDTVPVLPDCSPGFMLKWIPENPPTKGDKLKDVFNDLENIIMPGMTHWNHPCFFAYFAASGAGPGILGELLTAALNINAMVWKSCPSATELERITLNWLRDSLGLPDTFWGITYDGASLSTLHGIAAARENLSKLKIREKGMAGRPTIPRLRLYTSDQAHSSVDKAAIALGLGLESCRKINTDADYRMIPEELTHAIREDRECGWQPFCVVASLGTTSSSSIDPIPDIVQICEKENLWLHVDAAYGGSAAIVPEFRHILDGCDQSDSIVVNPHKWLFTPFDMSVFYTRHPDILKRAFSHVPEYLKTAEDPDVENLMDYGLPLGRRFRALKLWFVLRYFGTDGIADRIGHHIRLAKLFSTWVNEKKAFELMAPVPLSTVCFRYHPSNMDDEDSLNKVNAELLARINGTRKVFLSHTKLRSAYVIRLAIGNIRTEEKHVRLAWDIIREQAEYLNTV